MKYTAELPIQLVYLHFTNAMGILLICLNQTAMNKIELKPITLDEEYRKKWNIHSLRDFVQIYVNDILKSEQLYRIGGMGVDLKQPYFMILKQVEAIYDFKFIKQCYPNKSNKELESQRNHLEDCWCILDNNGDERVLFKQFDSPYLKGGLIYLLNNAYYNIETGEMYCDSVYRGISSKEFVFVDNSYDKIESRRGVMKINKNDGSFEIFP